MAPTPTQIPYPAPGNPNVPYAPGWNIVSGPTGTRFPVDSLFRYAGGDYVASGGATTESCEGYWAYFPAPMVVSIEITNEPGGVLIECPLQAGWNLVGNPFSQPASLPDGTTAFHWDGAEYAVVGRIELGQGVWIYSEGTSAITLMSL